MSDYETVQKRHNILVGVFVLLGLCALVWMVVKFEEMPTKFAGLNSYQLYVKFPTSVGIQQSTAVKFCGYPIGKVAKVDPPQILQNPKTGKYYYQTRVTLNIKDDYNRIPADTDVILMRRGLGSSYIELQTRSTFDAQNPSGSVLADGDLLQGSVGMANAFLPEESQKKLEVLVDNIIVAVENFNSIIGDNDNKENIKKILANLSQASGESIKAIAAFEELAQSAIGLSENLYKVTVGTEQLLCKINDGDGTIARLINDGRLYEEMLETTNQLDQLFYKINIFMNKANKKGLPIKLK